MASNFLHKFDRQIGRLVPNFNLRAILYLSLIFALALYVEVWHISPPSGETKRSETQKTMDRAVEYWNNSGEPNPPQQRNYEQPH